MKRRRPAGDARLSQRARLLRGDGSTASDASVLGEPFFELDGAATTDPAYVRPNLGDVPVLVGVSILGGSGDLEGLERSRRDLDGLRPDDEEGVLGLPLAVGLLEFAAVLP